MWYFPAGRMRRATFVAHDVRDGYLIDIKNVLKLILLFRMRSFLRILWR